MLARVSTFAIDGVDPRHVWVEVDIRSGLPSFTIVGLGDAAVRESRDRIRAAILNSGFKFPESRITANLAPAFLRKAGPGFDAAHPGWEFAQHVGYSTPEHRDAIERLGVSPLHRLSFQSAAYQQLALESAFEVLEVHEPA